MCSDCAGGVSCGDTGDPDELRAHLVDDGTISGVLAPVDVKSGVCDECGLVTTHEYCFDCGMWVCSDCQQGHDSGDEDFDDEDDWDDESEEGGGDGA